MRLKVLICPTAQGAPENSFLEISQPAFTLEELAASIEARHARLYPHQPQLIIHKLQDADFNDLDLQYTVGDVFSDKSQGKSSSIVRVIRSTPDRAGSIPPESALRPRRKHGRERAHLGLQGWGGSRLSHSSTPGGVLDETMLGEELESGESFQERERKRHKSMTVEANDEEGLDSQNFEQQRVESSVHEVVPESSCIGAEDSLVWSTDGHQPPNRRLFAKPSSPIHDRNLASSLSKGKDPDTLNFRFTRTMRSIENRVEVPGTQASQPSPSQENGASHPRWFPTNGAPAIQSPGSSVDAKEEELTSPASIQSSCSPFLARGAPHSASTLDDARSTNSTQDTLVRTQSLPKKAYKQASQQALRHQLSQPQRAGKDLSDIDPSDSESENGGPPKKQGHNLPPIDTPSTQLLIGLALQEGAMRSPLSEKITDQSKLAMERAARAAAAQARRQISLEESVTDDDMCDEEDGATDSETEQQMEEELKKVEEKARKVKEEEVRKAKEEEAKREKEEITRKAQEEARKAKEGETRKKKEDLARKAQEEERLAREEKVRKDKEEEEARMKEQQEAEKRKAAEALRKAEEAKAAVEAEKKKAVKAAEKEIAEKKKAEAKVEKLRKKQEQEELKRIEKERKVKEKAEELERKKQEKAKQREKGKPLNNAKKAPEDAEDAEENSTVNEDTTPKALELPVSQASKRQRSAPNENSPATEVAPQGKRQKTTKTKQANNPKVDDAPDLNPLASPKVVSALKKTSPNGTPAAKARRSVSFVDMGASVLAPQNSSASEAPAKVYPRTPVPPPVFIPGAESTLVPGAKPAAKSKTPIPLPDLHAAMKATTKKATPTKAKAAEKRPKAAKDSKSKLSQELIEESESELDNAQQLQQKAAPPTQDQAEAETQKKVMVTKAQKETVSRAQEDSDIDMDYVPANEVAPKTGGRVTRAVAGAVLHEPLLKSTRGKKVTEVAASSPPAFTSKPVHDVWNLSSTSEDDEEDEKGAGPSRAQKRVSEIKERSAVIPRANPTTKPNSKSSLASSETDSGAETTSRDNSEPESDDASPSPKSTPRAPSPKALQIANNLTKALGRTTTSNTVTPTASQQIPPSSQPVKPFIPPSTQKYKSLSQLVVEEDYPEVSENFSSQAAKKREAGSDSDDEGEEESSSESESGSDSDSSSGADIIPNIKRAGGASSADKKKSGGRNSLGRFLNRSKLAVFLRMFSWVS
ncbi:hypothetical protein EV426DRAFT_705015 [Tirmania nivea]|nr:hypothetical protein EV426DRAFT_705015 [Tirmania nivea]